MKRMKKILCFAVILLVLFSVSCSPVYANYDAAIHPEILSRATVIEAALDAAFEAKADAVDAEIARYTAEGTILKDAEGNELDMDALLAEMAKAAEDLRSLAPEAYQLAILEDLYADRYIGAYTSFADLAPDIADYLFAHFDLSALAQATAAATDGIIIAYQRLVGDTYASYYNESDYAEYMAGEQAQYSGIGVTVTLLDDGYAEILNVTPESPAEKAGILPGDILIAVGDEDFAKLGYSAAINRIRGESGTEVTVTVRRGETPFTYTMVRATLTEYTVEYKMLTSGDGKIGYIRITQFDEGTFTQFKAAHEALVASGAEKFVFDVRNNPGGRVDSVLAVLEYILPDDSGLPLLHMQFKDETETYYTLEEYLDGDKKLAELYKGCENHEIKAPIAVLCNEYTASAGELFTAGLMDFEVAEVYGMTTYGKGTGQSGFYMTDLYAYGNQYSPNIYLKYAIINVSTFYFYTAKTENHEGIGITPHHIIDLSEEAKAINFYKLTEENDNQLAAAVSALTDASTQPSPTLPDNGTEESGSVLLWVLFGVLASAFVALTVILILLLKRSRKEAYPTSIPTVPGEDDPENK